MDMVGNDCRSRVWWGSWDIYCGDDGIVGVAYIAATQIGGAVGRSPDAGTDGVYAGSCDDRDL